MNRFDAGQGRLASTRAPNFRHAATRFAAVLALAMFASAGSAGETLHIRTQAGDPHERLAAQQLQHLVEEYDVQRWIYTRDVLIDKEAIPHSHPVLTLDLGAPDDEQVQLASFLHEQFHWYLDTKGESVSGAMKAFEHMFPDAPSGKGAGARDRQSTYLHLIVCDLEFQAMTRLVSEKRARDLLGGWRHYTWIYEQVLGNPQVRRINAEFGLLLP